MKVNYGLRIALRNCAIGLLAFVAVGIFLSVYGGNIYLEGRNALFVKEAQTAAQLLSNIPLDDLEKNATFYARQISAKAGVRVTIIDNQGNVLGDSALEGPLLENHLNRPEVQKALKGEVGLERRYSTTENLRNLYVAVSIGENPPVRTVLRLSVPTAIWDADLSTIYCYSWIGIGLGFAIFLILNLLFSNLLRRPLRQMVAAIQDFRKGKLRSIHLHRSDELGQLGEEVNSLMEHADSLSREKTSFGEKWQAYLDQDLDGVLLLNEKLEVIWASPQARKILGLMARQLLKKTLLESTLDHNLAEACRRAIESSKSELIPYQNRMIFLSGAALRSPGPEFAILWLRDLTELESLKAVRRDFIANVSHELKTPVASLKIMVETLLAEPPPPLDVQRDFLQRSYREIDYLQSLIEALSKLSLIESGKAKFKYEIADLRTLLRELWESLTGRAEEQEILFEVSLPEEPLRVRADFLYLREAFLAILDNSFKFTPAGRTVQVQASRQGDWAVINFRDQGVGISKEDLPRIFERFYKADKGRGTSGFGIGLSLARHIVESFNGTITVISEEGKGSLFIIRLPVESELEGQI